MEIIKDYICEKADSFERVRIPCIVCDKDGVLYACYELRKSDSDWAVIDIGMRKSTDNGQTWSELKILVSGENRDTVNNPVFIADGDVLHFIYCVNYRKVFYMKSTDKGESWQDKREIGDKIIHSDKDLFYSCIATGPCHGISISSGRLVVPVWMAYNREEPENHHPSVICVLYSDDKGKTWNTGKTDNTLSDASEFSVAELSSGELVACIRHEGKEKCRAWAEITDSGEIVGISLDESFPDPICCAGFCAADGMLLFSNCAHKEKREKLTLRKLSEKRDIQESLLINEHGGYSDIAVSPDNKTAYILYENEKTLRIAVICL